MASAPKTPKRADTLTIAAAAPADTDVVPLAGDTAVSGLQPGGGEAVVGDQHATGTSAPAEDAGGVPLESDTAASGLELGGGQPDVGDQHATGTAVASSGIAAGDSLAAVAPDAQPDRDLYLVIERVLHNGETFVAGDLISLTGKEAAPLLGSFIVPDAE